jgi:hypothetical protein
VKDFLDRSYPGTRLLATNGNPMEMRLELSTEGRVHFNEFLQANRLFGKTAILSTSPPALLFDNKLGKTLRQKNLWASFGSGSLPST